MREGEFSVNSMGIGPDALRGGDAARERAENLSRLKTKEDGMFGGVISDALDRGVMRKIAGPAARILAVVGLFSVGSELSGCAAGRDLGNIGVRTGERVVNGVIIEPANQHYQNRNDTEGRIVNQALQSGLDQYGQNLRSAQYEVAAMAHYNERVQVLNSELRSGRITPEDYRKEVGDAQSRLDGIKASITANHVINSAGIDANQKRAIVGNVVRGMQRDVDIEVQKRDRFGNILQQGAEGAVGVGVRTLTDDFLNR